MNRCIHCYRCARFYQEITGDRDLGAMGIGNRTYFGRTRSGTLESPFSGNLVDLCPTGVFTDKPSRYFGRRWDYQRRPTVCIHCSLGCGLVTSARYRQVARQEARFHPAVNGWFVCDRGRHGFHYASLAERPRQARVQAERAGFDDALAHGRERLAAVQAAGGPRSVALVASARGSLETLAAAAALARTRGWRGPAVFAEDRTARNVAAALARLEPDLAVSLREIERADCVLVVGADPLHEAPMLALAVRQAARAGAAVVTVDPRAVWLPCAHAHIPVAPAALAETLGRLLRAAIPAEGLSGEAARFHAALPAGSAETSAAEQAAAARLRECRRPIVVCGTDIVPPGLVGLAADGALMLRAAGKDAGLFYVLPGANAAGAALLADPADSVRSVLQAAADGSVKALVVVESDPLGSFPDRALLEAALARLELLVAIDYLDSPTSRRAGILLPSQTVFEAGGTFVNNEGRAQESPPVLAGGAPCAIPARATTRRGSSDWGCPGPTRGRRGGSWQASQARRATKLHRTGCGATWPRPAPGTRRCASCPRSPRTACGCASGTNGRPASNRPRPDRRPPPTNSRSWSPNAPSGPRSSRATPPASTRCTSRPSSGCTRGTPRPSACARGTGPRCAHLPARSG